MERLDGAEKWQITEYAAQKIKDLDIVKKLHKIVVKCAEEEKRLEGDERLQYPHKSARLTALSALSAIRDGNLADITKMQSALQIDADGVLGRDSIFALVDFCMQQGEGFDADRFPQYSETAPEKKNEKPAESLPESMDWNQFAQLVIAEVVPMYLEKLKSPEGIELSLENIYTDILGLIGKYETKFGPEDPRAKVLASIRKNYFEPKEPNGKARVEYLIKNVILQEQSKKNLTMEDLENAFENLVAPGLHSLVDISDSLDDTQLTQVFNTIASITEVRDFFKNHPDIECIAKQILPQLLRSNKNTFVGSCRTFFTEIKPFILEASNNGGQLPTDARVRIVNRFSTFLKNIVNKDNANAMVDKLQEMETIKNNPILKDALAIVQHLDAENKNLLVQYTLDFLAEASSKGDSNAQGEVYIQKVFTLFFSVREQIAQNPELENSIRRFLDTHISPHVQKSDIESWVQSMENKTKLPLSKVLWALDYLKVNFANGVTDTILFVLKSSLLALAKPLVENDEDIKALAAKAVKAGKHEIRTQIGGVNLENKTQTLEGDARNQLSLLVAQNFTQKIRTLFLDTLRDGGKIKKEDFYPIIVSTLKEALSEDRQMLLQVLKEVGVEMENATQEQILEKVIGHLIASEAFMAVVGQVIDSVLEYKPIDTTKMAQEIGNILSSSVKNSLTTHGPALYKIAFGDLLYGKDIAGPEATNLIIATYFKNSTPSQQNGIKTIIALVQKHVSPNAFNELFDAYATLQKSGNSAAQNGIALVGLILDKVDSKAAIADILASGVIGQLLEKGPVKGEQQNAPNLTPELLATGLDLLYKVGDQMNDQSYASLFAQLGLDSLFGELTPLFLNHTKDKKEQLKNALIANVALINELIANPNAWKQNPQVQTSLLRLVDQIYTQVDKKGEFLEKLSAKFATQKPTTSEKTPNAEPTKGEKIVFVLDAEKAALLGKTLYATLDEVDDARLGNIVKNILSGYGAQKIMDMQIFGKTLQSHIRFVLSELGSEGFVAFLQDNLVAINSLIGKENEILSGLEVNKPDTDMLLVKMASDLKKRIKPAALEKQIGQKATRFLSIFGESLEKREQKIGALLPAIRKVNARISDPKNAPRPNEKEIEALGGEMFDALSEAVKKMSSQDIADLKEMVQNAWIGKADKNKTTPNPENKKTFGAIFFESFTSLNRGFLVGEFIRAFFSIKPEKIFVHYFEDPDNKENFVATCKRTFANHGV